MLPDRVGHVRIRSGQRRLIYATAMRVGLRDEQLHDLVENASDFRTRALAQLTIGEARRLIGVLKRMERAAAQPAPAGPPATIIDLDDATLRAAAQRGRASA